VIPRSSRYSALGTVAVLVAGTVTVASWSGGSSQETRAGQTGGLAARPAPGATGTQPGTTSGPHPRSTTAAAAGPGTPAATGAAARTGPGGTTAGLGSAAPRASTSSTSTSRSSAARSPGPVRAAGRTPSRTATAAPATKPNPAAPQAAPGTYTYDITGSNTSPFGTQKVDATTSLVVDPAGGDGFQHSTKSSNQSSTELTVRFASDAVRLRSVRLTFPTVDETFTFDSPVVFVPTPAKVGSTWSWKGTSADGTTVDFSGAVKGAGSSTVGGRTVAVALIESTLHLVGSGYDITTQQSDSYDEADKVITEEHQVADGKVSGFTIHSDTVEKLRSLNPS
jgi:hypothetical protein